MNIWNAQDYLKKIAGSENTLGVAGFGDVTQINEALINDMVKLFPSLDQRFLNNTGTFQECFEIRKNNFITKQNYNISVKMWLEKKLLFELAIPFEDRAVWIY